MDTKIPTKIYIGELCYKTCPCHHDVGIAYTDGTEEILCMDGMEIYKKYSKFLTPFWNKHFKRYLNNCRNHKKVSEKQLSQK